MALIIITKIYYIVIVTVNKKTKFAPYVHNKRVSILKIVQIFFNILLFLQYSGKFSLKFKPIGFKPNPIKLVI